MIEKPLLASGNMHDHLISMTESRPGKLADTFFKKRNSTKTAQKLMLQP